MTVTGYAFDAGSGSAQINTTGADKGLTVVSTQDGATGVYIKAQLISASPAVSVLDHSPLPLRSSSPHTGQVIRSGPCSLAFD